MEDARTTEEANWMSNIIFKSRSRINFEGRIWRRLHVPLGRFVPFVALLKGNFMGQFICQIMWTNREKFDYFIRSLIAIMTRVNRLIIFYSAFSAIHIY